MQLAGWNLAMPAALGPEIRLHNTLTSQKEIFKPRVPGQITFYSCGPTVYNLIHIGNLRGALVADLFFRFFSRVGYKVNFVRNYTDVEDKIIKKANEEGVTAEEIARRYTLECEKDFAYAGLREPTHKTKVTTHMPEIIAMIEKIIANGFGYVIDGEVLFAIDRDARYGQLSKKPLEDLQAGIRIEVNSKKRNPLDFTLWKPAKLGEPFWESPWGNGRPGWHIECSAMACRWLGDQIDLHHGGEDLIFPHHENEIAQSEAASGKHPFVSVWVHHAFLNMSKEKMSKSLGNVLSARDFLVQYNGEIARYLLLSVHYRSLIEFGSVAVQQCLASLTRLYETKLKAFELSQGQSAVADPRAESVWGNFLADCEKARTEIQAHFANDLNTPGALGSLFVLIREFNRTLSTPLAQATPGAILGSRELIRIMEEDIGDVLGIGQSEPLHALQEIHRVKAASENAQTSPAVPIETEILAAIAARKGARLRKDFAEADRIRKELQDKGIILKDGPAGTSWGYT